MGPRGPPCPGSMQEVLWILREGSHASSRDIQQQVVCLVGIGRSHVAFVASIEHPNAEGGIGRCEPEQVQREQPPRQSCPDDGDPAHCFLVSPRFVVLLVRALSHGKDSGSLYPCCGTLCGMRTVIVGENFTTRFRVWCLGQSGWDRLRWGQPKTGSNSGGTSTSMLRATPGCRRISPARSRVSTIW